MEELTLKGQQLHHKQTRTSVNLRTHSPIYRYIVDFDAPYEERRAQEYFVDFAGWVDIRGDGQVNLAISDHLLQSRR